MIIPAVGDVVPRSLEAAGASPETAIERRSSGPSRVEACTLSRRRVQSERQPGFDVLEHEEFPACKQERKVVKKRVVGENKRCRAKAIR